MHILGSGVPVYSTVSAPFPDTMIYGPLTLYNKRTKKPMHTAAVMEHGITDMSITALRNGHNNKLLYTRIYAQKVQERSPAQGGSR